ncbi:MAG: M23 family metallopeptidase [Litorilinea sp.]
MSHSNQQHPENNPMPGLAQVPTGETANAPHLRLETRPALLIGAINDTLPFPNLGPTQELCFDLGITAYHAPIELTGLVFKGYSGHQLLFEQRWPARLILQKTGESSLTIGAGTGLAVRGLYFLLHAYEPLGFIEVTAVGKIRPSAENAGAEVSEEGAEENATSASSDSASSDSASSDSASSDSASSDSAATTSATTTQAVLQIPITYHTQKTEIHFPLEGAWWAIQAGDWSDHHKREPYSQSYALDFVRLGTDNEFFYDRGLALEDHYSWDAPVYAAAGGKVAYLCYDMPDMQPGEMPDPRMFRDDSRRVLGNAVAVSHANGEFSYYAHLQQASLEVNDGQMIRRGQRLGCVGNSGQSPGPHLHFHLMEGPNLFIDRGLPVKFTQFWAGGQYFDTPTQIPTRMIVHGPARETPPTP